MENIVSSAKTDMFRIRINPVLRKQLENLSRPQNKKSIPNGYIPPYRRGQRFFSAVSECRRLSFRGE